MKYQTLKVAAAALCAGLIMMPLSLVAAMNYHQPSSHFLPQSSAQSPKGPLLDLQNKTFLQNSTPLVGRYICPTCD